SCTGAPKIRAMEIINSLEPTGREVYTGAIGYAGPLAGLALNVAIRTFEFSGGRVRLGVGGGIVADSDPHEEAHETLVKAVPLLAAVGAHFGSALTREWAGHVPTAHPPPSSPAPWAPERTRGIFPTASPRAPGRCWEAGRDARGTSPLGRMEAPKSFLYRREHISDISVGDKTV
ncbi:chorismate-binding protein, partial [Kocuria dechangensis]|uniref:chorismate-binding protein n=1 Tax=Kocuria dechangensis TaxID=1176249 RepID=UPI001E438253